MKCENCKIEHKGSYGSGRFCSRGCANSRERTPEIKERIRQGNIRHCQSRDKKAYSLKMTEVNNRPEKLEKIRETWRNKRDPAKYRKCWIVEEVGLCEVCGIKEWNNQPITFEVHHKNGDNTDNRKNNLQCLCPNCHSQTEGWRGRVMN